MTKTKDTGVGKVDKVRLLLMGLHILLLLSFVADYQMSAKALESGKFYETNKLSNWLGLEAHLFILMVMMGFAVLVFAEYAHRLGIAVYIILNLIWWANNAYSVYLLSIY